VSGAQRSEQEADIREAGIPPSRRPTNEEGIRQHRFTPPPGATTLLIVRHGESAAEVPGRPFALRDGHGDPELHPNGVRQAELLADRLEYEQIDAIYVTTLRRTHQTAAPLAARIGLTPIEEPDLHEVFLGEWEGGIFRSRAIDNDPVFQEIFRQERWDVIPGAEPHDEFDARVWGAFERIVAAHAPEPPPPVLHESPDHVSLPGSPGSGIV
jgi:probable phosphoglycerate mutase